MRATAAATRPISTRWQVDLACRFKNADQELMPLFDPATSMAATEAHARSDCVRVTHRRAALPPDEGYTVIPTNSHVSSTRTELLID